MHCKCKRLLFVKDMNYKGVIKIKHRGTIEYSFDINGKGSKLHTHYKAVRRGKHYFFDIIQSMHNIIKIMCYGCRRHFVVNIDDDTSYEVAHDYWPALG